MRQCFLVSKDFGLNLLKTISGHLSGALVLHPDDRGDSRTALSSFEALCNDVGAELRVVSSRKEADAALQAYQPDVVFVCGWYWIVSEDVLNMAERGFYGIHNSLLPKYRGGSPLVWSIINGDPEIGSSLFKLSPGMDDGPIVAQVRIENPPGLTIGDALAQIERGFETVFPKSWDDIISGKVELQEQDHGQASFCAMRKPEDGRVDWSWSAEKIHNFVRAQSHPYPGAFTMLDDRKIVIEKTHVPAEECLATPGQMLGKNTDGSVRIACGQNDVLIIDEIRAESGEKPGDVITSLACRFN